jgi:exodeoxyribonuclease VII small subunit
MTNKRPAPEPAVAPATPSPLRPVDPPIAGLGFDEALAQLQDEVATLEAGNLPLEASLAAFERGVVLHDHCARLLDDADIRVQRLLEEAGGTLRAVDLAADEIDGPQR